MVNRSKRIRKKSKMSRKRQGGWPFSSALTPEQITAQTNKLLMEQQDNKTLVKNVSSNKAVNLKDSINSEIKELERVKTLLASVPCNPAQLTLNDVINSFKYGNFPVKALRQLNSIVKSMISLVVDSNFGLTLDCVGPNSTVQSGMCSVPSAGDKKIFNLTEFKNNILHLIPSNVEDIKKLLNPSGGVFGAIGAAVKMTYNVATHASTILHIKQKAAAGAWKDLKIKEVVEVLNTLKVSIIPKLTIEGLPTGNKALVVIIEEVVALLNIFSDTQPNTGICNRAYEVKTIDDEIKKLSDSLLAKPMQPAIEDLEGGKNDAIQNLENTKKREPREGLRRRRRTTNKKFI